MNFEMRLFASEEYKIKKKTSRNRVLVKLGRKKL